MKFYILYLGILFYVPLFAIDWFATNTPDDPSYKEKHEKYMRPYCYLNYMISGGYPHLGCITGGSLPETIQHLKKNYYDDPYANHLLGCIYHFGLGIEVDPPQAIHFYEKSLDLNYSSASLNNLGALYLKLGQFELAQKYLFLAAIQGNNAALKNLADLYEIIDDNRMKFWCWEILAEKNNDSEALKKLAEMYEQGIGTEKNIEWSKKCTSLAEKYKDLNKKSNASFSFYANWPYVVIQNVSIDISRIDLGH